MPKSVQSSTAAAIRHLAETHQVVYERTHTDLLAHHMTRLAGDHVEFDEVERMLVALQRAGFLTRQDAVRLQASYLREAKP